MKAVIIKGLKDVAVEDRPIPSIQSPTDIVVKTHVSGLCGERVFPLSAYNVLTSGSDLHNYRQAEPGTGFSLGHEVVGEVVEVGPGVTKFKVGDVVSAPFSICCGESRVRNATQTSGLV
jgi:threonine dehydrogenase-like Zn-dependent dehydrogenase